MFDSTDVTSIAELIEEVGAPVHLKTMRSPEYNAATSEGETTDREFDGKAVELKYSARDVNGDSIRTGDLRLLISVRTVGGGVFPRPLSGDRIEYDGAWWNVVTSDRIRAGTLDFAYEVQGRK